MKKQMLIYLPVAILLILSSAESKAMDLSLAKALQMVDNSPKMVASGEYAEAARGRLMAANGAFMPGVNVSEIYKRTDDPVSVFAAKLQQGKFTAGDFALDKLNNPNSVNNWTTRVELQQPIIHSGTDIEKRAVANEAYKAAVELNRFDKQNMKLKMTVLYYNAVAYREKLKVIDNGIKMMKSLEAGYEQAGAPTSANSTNYLVAKSVRSNLEAQRVRTSTLEENTKRLIASILGVSGNEEITLTDNIPNAPSTLNEANKNTEATRPDVKASEANYKAAVHQHKAAKWTYGPNVDAFAAYNRYTGNFDGSNGSYEAGFMISLPIFAGPRFGNVREALAQRKMAENLYKATSLEAEAELKNSDERYKACIEQYGLILKATKEATSALGLAKQRYAEGSLPLLDYSQTIQNWTTMQQGLIDSLYSVAESSATRDYQRGAL